MMTSVAKGGTEKLRQNLRLSKHTDLTIHWKALEEHFLMVPLDFRFNHFQEKNAFSEFFSKHIRP
jgi:RNAse (barnase) inhibitor barstar